MTIRGTGMVLPGRELKRIDYEHIPRQPYRSPQVDIIGLAEWRAMKARVQAELAEYRRTEERPPEASPWKEEVVLADHIKRLCVKDLNLADIRIGWVPGWFESKRWRSSQGQGGAFFPSRPQLILIRKGLSPEDLVFIVAHELKHFSQWRTSSVLLDDEQRGQDDADRYGRAVLRWHRDYCSECSRRN